MTIRTIALLAVCLAPASAAASQLILLEGEITNGAFFVPGESGPPTVFQDFPVPYTAIFNSQPAIALATFQFTPLTGGQPTTQLIDENLFPGVLRNDAEALVVDYDPPLKAFMNFFELTLDKATGQGQWRWLETCSLCDRAFDPFAQATITAFREVLSGDFNEDGNVDGEDLTNWMDGFGATSSATHRQGDADSDQDVDGADFLIWQQQLGIAAAVAENAAVPEPAMLSMLVWGMLAMFIRRRVTVS